MSPELRFKIDWTNSFQSIYETKPGGLLCCESKMRKMSTPHFFCRRQFCVIRGSINSLDGPGIFPLFADSRSLSKKTDTVVATSLVDQMRPFCDFNPTGQTTTNVRRTPEVQILASCYNRRVIHFVCWVCKCS